MYGLLGGKKQGNGAVLERASMDTQDCIPPLQYNSM